MTLAHSSRLHWLDPRQPAQPFPDAAQALADPNGLLAIGGDLSPVRLLNAYRAGIFPWFNPDEPILWWSPDPRCVFVPDQLHVSRSLAKRMRQCDYAVSFDRAFAATLEACAGPRRAGRGTWLGPEMREAYLALHQSGAAHSVEVWREGALIGGLYGVSLGRIFFGESMFSHATDASKLALVHLAQQLGDWGFPLIDCQVASPHLLTLGAVTLPRAEFRLASAAAQQLKPPRRWQFHAEHAGDARHFPA